MQETHHFALMLHERGIKREWIELALDNPDKIETREDNTRHYIKMIPANNNRWLRVIINAASRPEKLITAFFDRRLRRNHENQV